MPVGFTLCVRKRTAREEIKRVGTHPHAWAQCRNWLTENLPGVRHVPATSTAAGAKLLAEGEASYDAALCSAISATRYQLEVVEENVADNRGGRTRFVVVAKPGVPGQATGADKTTLQITLRSNEAGALLSMLQQVKARAPGHLLILGRPGRARARRARTGGLERPAQALSEGPVHRLLPACRPPGNPGRDWF